VAVDTNSTAGGSALQWWHVSNVTWGASLGANLARLPDMPVATYSWDLCSESRNCIPQPGTSVGLDTLSDRLMYRAGYRTVGGVSHVVLNHTVNVAGSGTHAAVRWYDVTDVDTTPTLVQQGTYAPDADNRWMGSAAMDSAGDIAVGYSVSSSSTSPSIRYAGRSPADAAGTLGAEGVLKAGTGSQTSSSNRWGDYSSLVVDPVDGCTFWYTNEYYSGSSSSSWRTWVGSFSFPGCGTSTSVPSAPASAGATAVSGTSDQVDVSWSGSSGATDYPVYSDGVQVADPTTTTWRDSGLAGSTQHSYCVYAHNALGTSAGCALTASVTTNPPPPSSITAATGTTGIDVGWSPVTGAASYTVERATAAGGPWSTANSDVTSTSWTDTGVVAGTTYYYRVRTAGSGGVGSPSTTASATAPGAPGPFTLSGSATGTTSVTLAWTASSAATGYQAWRRKGNKGSFARIATVAGSPYPDTGLSPGTSYSYYVVATGNGGSTRSNTVTVRTPRR
jgi:fibronectin type 3 domain-containing protein